jgi:hypothetical protein
VELDIRQQAKNRAPRRIFEPMRDELIGGWKQLNNEQLHDILFTENN